MGRGPMEGESPVSGLLDRWVAGFLIALLGSLGLGLLSAPISAAVIFFSCRTDRRRAWFGWGAGLITGTALNILLGIAAGFFLVILQGLIYGIVS